MFKLLKPSAVSVKEQEQKMVEQIHNEFDTAPDRCLQQAMEIINQAKGEKVHLESTLEDKAVRLQNLGFSKNGLVDKLRNINQRNKEKDNIVAMQEEEAQLILYYKETYPFLKFLPESELDRICDKYGLIYAPVGHYKMPVPDKNLEEIENAQPAKTYDYIGVIRTISVDRNNIAPNASPEIADILLSGEKIYQKPEPEIDWSNPLNYDIHIMRRRLSFRSRESLNDYYFKHAGKEHMVGTYTKSMFSDFSRKTIDKSGLFIAAPKSHFDLTGLEHDKNKGYFQVTKQEVKDPIVFRYVRGGVQILTKWGLEAEDPALQIEILN